MKRNLDLKNYQTIKKPTYCEYIFIRGIPIFVVFVGASKPRI